MTRTTRRAASSLLGAAVLSAVGLVGAPALAAPAVTCGATITRSVTLTQSLDGCAAGLKVGADDVVIDLGGNFVSGAFDAPGAVGIDVQGHRNVTIRNGGLDYYDRPVDATGAPQVTLRNLTMGSSGSSTVELSGATGATIVGVELARLHAEGADRLRFDGGGFGQLDVQGQGVRVAGATVQGLDGPEGSSLRVRGDDAQVLRVGGSGVNVLVVGDRARIEEVNALYDSGFLELRGNGGVLRANSMVEASRDQARGAAITVTGDRNQLIGNTSASNAGIGILVTGSDNVLRRNSAVANSGHGIVADQPTKGSNTARENGEQPDCVNVTCVAG